MVLAGIIQKVEGMIYVLGLWCLSIAPLIKNDASVARVLKWRYVVLEVTPATGSWPAAVDEDDRSSGVACCRMIAEVNRSASTGLEELRGLRVSGH